RANKLRSSACTVESNIIEHHDANVGVSLYLLLQLALHRPIYRLIKNVGLGNGSAETFGQRAFARMAQGRRDQDGGLFAGPMPTQRYGQSSCNEVCSICV